MIAGWLLRTITWLGRRPVPTPAPPITIEERAARYRRGMAVREFLGPEGLLQLAIDGDILRAAATKGFPEAR